jgi:hypothetical protein
MKNKNIQRKYRRLIARVARADVRGYAVPLFWSRALNMACVRLADKIRKQWTDKHNLTEQKRRRKENVTTD